MGEPENHDERSCFFQRRGHPEACQLCQQGIVIVRQVAYCPCDRGQALLAGVLEERRENARLLRNSARLMAWEFGSGLPERFRGLTLWSSRPGAKKGAPPALPPDLIQLLTRRTPEAESWLLWGLYGRGKTGAAVGYARQWVFSEDEYERPRHLIFRATPDLLGQLRATYNRKTDETNDEEALITQCIDADILILDDIGAEQVNNTGWLEDRLYRIINGRHGENKATIATSNLSPEDLGKRIGERNLWRLYELAGNDHVVRVDGPNLRLGGAS